MKFIKLTKGKWAVVDDEDYDYLSQWKWYTHSFRYAARHTPRPEHKTVLMHRCIAERAGADTAKLIDHINGSVLDNRRENLRAATKTQNGQNRSKQRNNKSGYKGVSFDNTRRRWTARIKVQGCYKFLGYFENVESASFAYLLACKESHREFAKL